MPTHTDPVTYIRDVLRLSANALRLDPDLLPSQILGRLPRGLSDETDAFLLGTSKFKDHPWLRPLSPSLTLLGSLERVLEGHTDAVRSVAITPDGERAISTSWDKTLRVWNLHTGETEHVLAGNTDVVRAIAITPDGDRAVSWSWEETVRVWNLRTGEPEQVLEGHRRTVNAVAITPDGERAIWLSEDKTLWVWNLRSGETTALFRADYGLRAIASGVTHIVAGDDGGHVHILVLEGALGR